MSSNFTFNLDMFALTASQTMLEAQGCSFATIRQLGADSLNLRSASSTLCATAVELEPLVAAQLSAGQASPASSNLVAAIALQRALAANPLGLVTADLRADAVARSAARLEAAEGSFASGEASRADTLALEARKLLAGAVSSTFDDLRVASNLVAARDLEAMMTDLGFAVERAQASNGSHAIWARQGGQALAVVVSGVGSVEIDMLGYDGTDCVEVKNALQQRLRARGWGVAPFDSVLHQRRGGGALITEVSRLARELDCPPQQALLATVAGTAKSRDDSAERMRRVLMTRRAAAQRAC